MKTNSAPIILSVSDIEDFYADVEQSIDNCKLLSKPQRELVKRRILNDEEVKKLTAEMGASQSPAVLHNLANNLTEMLSRKAFLTVLSLVKSYADNYVVMILQTVLVYMIAYFGGHRISYNTAMEFTCSLTGISVFNNVYRKATQKLAEVTNIPEFCLGSNVRSGAAFGITRAVGNAAIAHYIDGKSIHEARKIFRNFAKIKYPDAVS